MKIHTENIISKIKTLADKYYDEILSIRRHLHQNPELSFKENNTSKYLKDILENFGLKPKIVAKTGLEIILKGKKGISNHVVALRADIDALPIQEKNTVTYKSKNPGIMHACGHDVHTANLVGVIKILKALENEFSGTVKCIFQPGEEQLPGGASIMINEGILKNPVPNSIFGFHVTPTLKVGEVGFCKNVFSASGDEIRIKIIGKGGHAAMPHKLIDPILTACQVITNLQSIISRNKPPNVPSLLSFGKIIGDGATNVIPNDVYIEGTFRAMNEEWRKYAHEKIKNFVHCHCSAMGAKCEIEIKKGYPSLINDEELVYESIGNAKLILGEKKIKLIEPFMFSEDFAYFAQKIKACFFALGIANAKITSNLHTPTFNIDERALKTSITLMTWLTINGLA